MSELPYINDEYGGEADTIADHFNERYFAMMDRILESVRGPFLIEPSKPIGEDYDDE